MRIFIDALAMRAWGAGQTPKSITRLAHALLPPPSPQLRPLRHRTLRGALSPRYRRPAGSDFEGEDEIMEEEDMEGEGEEEDGDGLVNGE